MNTVFTQKGKKKKTRVKTISKQIASYQYSSEMRGEFAIIKDCSRVRINKEVSIEAKKKTLTGHLAASECNYLIMNGMNTEEKKEREEMTTNRKVEAENSGRITDSNRSSIKILMEYEYYLVQRAAQ